MEFQLLDLLFCYKVQNNSASVISTILLIHPTIQFSQFYFYISMLFRKWKKNLFLSSWFKCLLYTSNISKTSTFVYPRSLNLFWRLGTSGYSFIPNKSYPLACKFFSLLVNNTKNYFKVLDHHLSKGIFQSHHFPVHEINSIEIISKIFHYLIWILCW